MLLVECLIPSKGVVQSVVEVLCRLTVGSTGSWVAVRKFSRQEVTVVMPLEAWSNIERIAETEWQGNLGIEDGVQDGLTLLQVDILLVKMIVVTTIGRVAATRILHLIAILVDNEKNMETHATGCYPNSYLPLALGLIHPNGPGSLRWHLLPTNR